MALIQPAREWPVVDTFTEYRQIPLHYVQRDSLPATGVDEVWYVAEKKRNS